MLFTHKNALIKSMNVDLKNDVTKYRIKYEFTVNQIDITNFPSDSHIIVNVYTHDTRTNHYNYINNHKLLLSNQFKTSFVIPSIYLNKTHNFVFVFKFVTNNLNNAENKDNVSIDLRLRLLEYSSRYYIYETQIYSFNALEDTNFYHHFDLKGIYTREKIKYDYTVDERDAKSLFAIEKIINMRVFVRNNVRDNNNIMLFGKYDLENYENNIYKQYFVTSQPELTFSTKNDVFVLAIINTTEIMGDEMLSIRVDDFTKEIVLLENKTVKGHASAITDNMVYFFKIKIIENIETEEIDVFEIALPDAYDLFSRRFKNFASFINNEVVL